METKKTIKLGVVKKGKNIICNDLTTLSLVLGTKGIAGNLSLYGVQKKDGKFMVNIDTVKERIKELQRRIAKVNNYLEVMRQVI